MKNFKNINNTEAMNELKQRNFNDENGCILRQFAVSNLDLLFMIAHNYRNDLAFGVEYSGVLYSMYKKDDVIFLKIRKWQENLAPVTEDYDICADYEEVKRYILSNI